MGQATAVRRYRLAEYLAMEPEGEVRHEFIDGEIFAMVGSSLNHNVIVTNLLAALHQHLRGTPCRVVANDRKVLIAQSERVYYPDLLVTCQNDPTKIDPYTETEPRLIVEVLSPSTAAVDRRQKRLDYQKLDSLQDYVLIAQHEPQVEVYHRQPDGSWLRTIYTAADTSVTLAAIDLEVAMMLIYEDVLSLSDHLP